MSNPLKVVDISSSSDDTVKTLLEAANSQGFLFVEGHDFSNEEVQAAFELSKRFFTETSIEEKMKYPIKNNVGYTGFEDEQLDPRKALDFKEAYNFGFINFETGELNQSKAKFYGQSEKSDANEHPIPPVFKDDEAFISKISQKLHATAIRILALIAEALLVEDPNFFSSRHRGNKPSGSVFRMLRYPLMREDTLNIASMSSIDPTIRAGAHTDYGSITLLFQQKGQQGLELQIGDKSQNDGWVTVPFVDSTNPQKAPPLIVNFGDLLSYWTNGVLKSTVHRVRFAPGETRNSDRYSIVFFVQPEDDTLLTPVPSEIVKKASLGGDPPAITALEHLQERLRATYQSEVK
ncbi:LAMI_0C09230g1_1 [Lachancea mirantina]|uniref:LAMI_0C09230g1_1 n=1 Tax=Lachancea mirantina TaxID=1230905 RepID=A0A1G4J536_9SACH|nr:LAMI_0C09230g1_1 [Lachancea mirantina]